MPMPITAHLVQCGQCGKTAIVADGENVHDALDCKCCPSSTHTHADENGATKDPCRSVHVSANAVVVPVIGG